MSSVHRASAVFSFQFIVLIAVFPLLPHCADATRPPVKAVSSVNVPAPQNTTEELSKEELLSHILESKKTSHETAYTDSGIRVSKGIYLGAPYTSTSYFSPTSSRIDFRFGTSRNLIVTSGIEHCWSQEPPVVHPCGPKALEQSRKAFQLDRAALLSPLLNENWRIVHVDKKSCGPQKCYYLEALHNEIGLPVVLEIDLDSLELRKLSYMTSMNGRAGILEITYSENKTFCHQKWPTVIKSHFEGELFWLEEIKHIQCQKIDETYFQIPPQVADETIVLRSLPGENQVCTTIRGNYLRYSEGVSRLSIFLEGREWVPVGPLENNLIAAPPEAKNANDYVTEQCFPIAQTVEDTPTVEEGDVIVKTIAPHDVLSIFSLGIYDEKNQILMRRLQEEAKNRNLVQAGAFRLIRHTDTTLAPADQWVSEMQMPVKAVN